MTTGSVGEQGQARRDDGSRESDATETTSQAPHHKQSSPPLLHAPPAGQAAHLQANAAAGVCALTHRRPWAPRALTEREAAEYRRALAMVRTGADVRWRQAIRLRRLIHDGAYPPSLDATVRGLMADGAHWRYEALASGVSLD